MNNNSNQPTRTFEDAFDSIKVDASTHNATSRFPDPTEGLKEESRLRLSNQDDVDEDFNLVRMNEDTTTQNLPFLLPVKC
jgi:hypothetical protein